MSLLVDLALPGHTAASAKVRYRAFTFCRWAAMSAERDTETNDDVGERQVPAPFSRGNYPQGPNTPASENAKALVIASAKSLFRNKGRKGRIYRGNDPSFRKLLLANGIALIGTSPGVTLK